MISSLWDSITSAIYSFAQALINVLPDSPFEYLQQSPQIYQILRYVNWFVPIDFFLSSMIAWLSAIGIYYTWQIILHWIGAID